MGEKKNSCFYVRSAISSECIRKRDELRMLVGTEAFPVLCPPWIEAIPDGRRFYWEMYAQHKLLTGVEK